MMTSSTPYIPAAGHHWLLPLYDPFTKLLGANRVREHLLALTELRAGHRVLDVGCGTGTLTILLKHFNPNVEAVGLDPDPIALACARRKAKRAGLSIQFDQGFSAELPYPNDSFHCVFSSYVFHHLRGEDKGKFIEEIRRVLMPGGWLLMADFGGPDPTNRSMLTRLLHSHAILKDNASSRVLATMSDAGLVDAKCVGQGKMLFARVAYYQASKSALASH